MNKKMSLYDVLTENHPNLFGFKRLLVLVPLMILFNRLGNGSGAMAMLWTIVSLPFIFAVGFNIFGGVLFVACQGAYAIKSVWVNDIKWIMKTSGRARKAWNAFTFKMFKERKIDKRLKEWFPEDYK